MRPEEEVLQILKAEGIDLVAALPCDKAKRLFALVPGHFRHVPLTREEEGVGICAGACLAGGKPVMLIQSSGVGNAINALCSLTKLYELPLPILVSWRGIYRENIIAQVPMGRDLPKILRALDIDYTEINERKDIPLIRNAVKNSYENEVIHVALLSPKIWGETSISGAEKREVKEAQRIKRPPRPSLTRLELIKASAPYLRGKAVISNLGIPSKELYHVMHQNSNFYMLGSMGMASPIGLGVALNTEKEVVVIEGDGSLLMNPGTLATISVLHPKNLTILAIDNGVYGSTGNQPTATATCVDLGGIASAFGIKRVYRVASERELRDTFEGLGEGPSFIHALAIPGNAEVPDIPLTPLQIKRQVMEFLK
jgi:sulfopyruvate decarboxylase subunit beta